MNARAAAGAASRPAFRNRADAGRQLGQALAHHATQPDVAVLGLARGGVPVAREVASALSATLGVLAVRRVPVPGISEVALGAIAEGSRRFVPSAVGQYIGIPVEVVALLTAVDRIELDRRASLYRASAPMPDVAGRTVILVDDGATTGATMRAAALAVRTLRPARIIAALPVASTSAASEIRADVDELTVLNTPSDFQLDRSGYGDYRAVTDDEVLAMLGGPVRRVSATVRDISERLGRSLGGPDHRSNDGERTIAIRVADGVVAGELGMPPRALRGTTFRASTGARGLVVLGHAGFGRTDYRKRYLAGRLRLAGFATLRVDLVTRDDPPHADLDPLGDRVQQMAGRLARVCDWIFEAQIAGGHCTTLLGSGLGGAVALVASTMRQHSVRGVIVRGARMELAEHALRDVQARVLLVVGGYDREAVESHNDARRRLRRASHVVQVPQVGRDFDERGALGAFAEHVVSWLERVAPHYATDMSGS